jgi:hypothetical protein
MPFITHLDRSRRQIELHTRLPKFAAFWVALLTLLCVPAVAGAQAPPPQVDGGNDAALAGQTTLALGPATGLFSFEQVGNRLKAGLMLKGKVPKGTKATVVIKLSIWSQQGMGGLPHKIVGTNLRRTYRAGTRFSLGVPRNAGRASFGPNSANWINWEASYTDKNGPLQRKGWVPLLPT